MICMLYQVDETGLRAVLKRNHEHSEDEENFCSLCCIVNVIIIHVTEEQQSGPNRKFQFLIILVSYLRISSLKG